MDDDPPAPQHTPSPPAAANAAKRYRAAPAKTFACRGYGECRMVFSRSEHLARHVRKHTGERPFACHCGKQFSRLDNLRQHAQTVHADKQEQNERMMRELTSLHTSMTAGAKRDARKKASVGHNVNSAAPPAGMLPPPNMNPQLNMMQGLVGPGVGGHVHAQSMSAVVKQEDGPARYGRGRPGTSAGYEGGFGDPHGYDPRRTWAIHPAPAAANMHPSLPVPQHPSLPYYPNGHAQPDADEPQGDPVGNDPTRSFRPFDQPLRDVDGQQQFRDESFRPAGQSFRGPAGATEPAFPQDQSFRAGAAPESFRGEQHELGPGGPGQPFRAPLAPQQHAQHPLSEPPRARGGHSFLGPAVPQRPEAPQPQPEPRGRGRAGGDDERAAGARGPGARADDEHLAAHAGIPGGHAGGVLLPDAFAVRPGTAPAGYAAWAGGWGAAGGVARETAQWPGGPGGPGAGMDGGGGGSGGGIPGYGPGGYGYGGGAGAGGGGGGGGSGGGALGGSSGGGALPPLSVMGRPAGLPDDVPGSPHESPFSFHPPDQPAASRKRAAPDTDFDATGRPTTAGSRPQSRRLSVMDLCNDGPGAAGRLLPVSRPGTADARPFPVRDAPRAAEPVPAAPPAPPARLSPRARSPGPVPGRRAVGSRSPQQQPVAPPGVRV